MTEIATATHGTLSVYNCARCGIAYALPTEYDDKRRQDGLSFYCPNRHVLSYHDSDREQLRKERERSGRLAARLDQVKADSDATERSRRAVKGQLTKVKKRVANGVCPCCNRSFADLAAHMTTRHPHYAKDATSA